MQPIVLEEIFSTYLVKAKPLNLPIPRKGLEKQEQSLAGIAKLR
jgi:hypothetical protein